jgi:diaminopimelate decarboxylase
MAHNMALPEAFNHARSFDFMTAEQASALVAAHGSPLYVYSTSLLRARARQLMGLQLPYGLTVRYAMKANPHHEIIALFASEGLHFDASSSYEVDALLTQGIPGSSISLSSQQPAHNLPQLLEQGIQFVATSMHQLRLFADVAGRGDHVALRINPGVGDGHSNRTNTGGVASSFGLWHEYIPQALALAEQQGISINRLHVHIGSGADSSMWGDVMDTALALVKAMPDVQILDIGGGYKVSRTAGEPEADMSTIMRAFAERLTIFAEQTGRQIHVEIEPGTWLVAHAAVLLAEVVDIVDTGAGGYTFLRLNTGMNDFIRPAMYGAQHAVTVLNDSSEKATYVVVGHNCETGDIITPAPHAPEAIAPRRMNSANIGDVVSIADVGAYGAAFCAKGYNAFPSAKEIYV